MINANFIVDPDDLKKVIISDPVSIRFIDPSRINFLGETGMKMAYAGFKFIVTKTMAKDLIENNIAVKITDK
jgi:hypothetical protein